MLSDCAVTLNVVVNNSKKLQKIKMPQRLQIRLLIVIVLCEFIGNIML